MTLSRKFSALSGLTLVELITTLGIIALLTGILVPAFRTFGARNTLNQGAQDVAQAITQARAYALAPRAQAPTGTTDYQIGIYTNKTYEIEEFTNGTAVAFKTSTLPAGLAFHQLPANPVRIRFSIVNQGAVSSMSPDVSELTITVRSTVNNERKQVIFTKATGTLRVE